MQGLGRRCSARGLTAAFGCGDVLTASAAPAALRWLEPQQVSVPAEALAPGVPASAPPLPAASQQPATSAPPALGAASQPTAAGSTSASTPDTQKRPSPLPVRAPARARARSHSEELRLVDSARQALQSGDAARTLDVLQHYEAKIADPQFELEVGVLRMEALDRLGRTGAAQRQARQLLARPLLARQLPEAQAARARAIVDRRESFE